MQNFYLKAGIHSANGLPQQAVRYVNIGRTVNILKENVYSDSQKHIQELFDDMDGATITRYEKVAENIYFGSCKKINTNSFSYLELSDECQFFLKMVKDNCAYTSFEQQNERTCNSYAMLKDKQFVQLHYFIKNDDQIFCIYRNVLVVPHNLHDYLYILQYVMKLKSLV